MFLYLRNFFSLQYFHPKFTNVLFSPQISFLSFEVQKTSWPAISVALRLIIFWNPEKPKISLAPSHHATYNVVALNMSSFVAVFSPSSALTGTTSPKPKNFLLQRPRYPSTPPFLLPDLSHWLPTVTAQPQLHLEQSACRENAATCTHRSFFTLPHPNRLCIFRLTSLSCVVLLRRVKMKWREERFTIKEGEYTL